MKRVFISGSIGIKKLPDEIIESLDRIEQQQFEVLVGDAKGVDLLIQKKLQDDRYSNVLVCSIYEEPRNLLSDRFKTCQVECDSSIRSERKKQTFKDSYMTRNSDYSLVVWDGKSKGSYANIVRSLEQDQAIKIYLSPEKRFLEKDEITERNMEKIFKSNNGYTSTDILNLIRNENIVTSIHSVKEFKDFLLQSKFVKQMGNQLVPSEQYADYFVVENYRGKTNIRFKSKIVDLIRGRSLF
jgi:hypothetical protein